MRHEHGLASGTVDTLDTLSGRVANLTNQVTQAVTVSVTTLGRLSGAYMDRHVRAKALDAAVALANGDRKYGIQAWSLDEILRQAAWFEEYIHTGKVSQTNAKI
jgi:hypothetical protein